jgi:hypothetical protein
MGQDETVTANGNTYNFVNHGGVSLCWVEEADVPAVLAMFKMCCGGRKKRPLFQPANQAQIDFWSKV